MACEFLDRCGFFRKFRERKGNVWKGVVGYYCKGSGFRHCESRKKFLEEGKFLDCHVLPTGKTVSKSFLDIP